MSTMAKTSLPAGGDSLDDILGARTESPKAAPALPASYQPRDFSEPCQKCGGTGVWRGYGQCFACKGRGKKTFKTSPAARAANRASAANRAVNKAQAALDAFKAEYPDVWAWMDGSTFPVAVSMLAGLQKYGSLTDRQIEAARSMIAKRDAKAAERAAQVAAAPVVDGAGVDRLMQAFDAARAYAASKAKGLTIRNPKITIGNMVISPAKAGSKNAGSLYVKGGKGYEAPYFGKITGGKFFAARECSAAQQVQVLAFIADPKAAAEAYGRETGVCCICDATLTSEWRLRGIGPICSQKYGWG